MCLLKSLALGFSFIEILLECWSQTMFISLSCTFPLVAEEVFGFEEVVSSLLSVILTVTSFIFCFDFKPLAFCGGTIRELKHVWSSTRSSFDVRAIGMVLVGLMLSTYCRQRLRVNIFNIFMMFSLKSAHLIVLDWVITLQISFALLEISTWYVKSTHYHHWQIWVSTHHIQPKPQHNICTFYLWLGVRLGVTIWVNVQVLALSFWPSCLSCTSCTWIVWPPFFHFLFLTHPFSLATSTWHNYPPHPLTPMLLTHRSLSSYSCLTHHLTLQIITLTQTGTRSLYLKGYLYLMCAIVLGCITTITLGLVSTLWLYALTKLLQTDKVHQGADCPCS